LRREQRRLDDSAPLPGPMLASADERMTDYFPGSLLVACHETHAGGVYATTHQELRSIFVWQSFKANFDATEIKSLLNISTVCESLVEGF
jgi:hypothetical protein